MTTLTERTVDAGPPGRASRDRDVIVIGAGHNGLVAAAYLQRAGLDTLVLEASPVIGGMLGSYPVIAEAPDHIINEGAIQASLFRASPIESDLDLGRFGLRQIRADPFHVHVDRDSGASLAIWENPVRTADEIRHFSRRDADAWLEMSRTLDVALDLVLPMMLTHPLRPSPKAVARMLKGAAKGNRRLADLVRMFSISHSETITERFEHPLVRGALAQMPAGFFWMEADFTGWALVYIGLCQRTGSVRFQGGTNGLSTAVHGAFLAAGGECRTAARVHELVVDADRVCGVRLESGEEIRAGRVMAACNPYNTLNEMLPKGMLGERLQRRAESIPVNTTGVASLKIDVACSGELSTERINRQRRDGLDIRGYITSWQTFEEHEEAWTASIGGRWPKAIPFIGLCPNVLDPTQAPAGQDTWWMWSGITPNFPQGGWDGDKQPIAQRVIDEAAQVFDGLDRLELGRVVKHATELEQRFNTYGGNVYHVSPMPLRFGPLRPAPGLSGYKLPVDGLWLTGAGTHPTGGISGIPGYNAAHTLLREARRHGKGIARPRSALSGVR
jgi:phytoene dehydrogenase-like protein